MNPIIIEHATSPDGISIDANVLDTLNLADHQNAIAVIRELWLVNDSDRSWSHLELALTSSPPFVKPRIWHIDTLAAGSRYPIRDADVTLDGGLLAGLSESQKTTLTFTLRTVDDTRATVFAQSDHAIELLPRNQWSGLGGLPDLIAAFVQPNDPAVDQVLKRAADVLRDSDRPTALNGYQDGAARAWDLASAIWGAVASLQLDYALPPASFEPSGQKVRSPSQIQSAGLATCLDLTLLFCATLEQAGLHPLIVFTEGHALAGVWLKPEEFSTTVVDDVTALRKRLRLRELVLFETTLATQPPVPGFAYAVERGARQVADGHDAPFQAAIDIHRARLQRIKPLASEQATADSSAAPAALPDQPVIPVIEAAPGLPDDDDLEPREGQSSVDPKDRLGRWQRKLLDLSLRNNLLNFRSVKKSLTLDAPQPELLEDLLSTGKSVKLLPRPDLMSGPDPRNRAVYESREREDVLRTQALDGLRRQDVFVDVPVAELESRLVELFRSARSTLQEGGSNTLYLALGFLSWTRDDRNGQRYRAPLILVPVTLHRKSARSGFSLTLHEDEPRFNPTLIEMLRQDFQLNLGVVEGELPRDETGLDVRAVWRAVAHAVKDIKGWEVTEDVVLAMFSFAKYLMWKDLAERSDQLRASPVVRHLLDTPRDPYIGGTGDGGSVDGDVADSGSTERGPTERGPTDRVPHFPEVRTLDQTYAPQQVFCPLPTDSSQLSAVLAASKGKDFVLIGPPGTGKSQTIANLIAQSMAEGRRVLFVSEKIAALDVVYRRLREIGLGEFCLELHSSKARKLDVLAQLRTAWEATGQADAQQWQLEADHLKRLRDTLNEYVDRLHARHANGLTIFDAIGLVTSHRDTPSLALSWPKVDQHDRTALDHLRSLADRLGVTAGALDKTPVSEHPLADIGHDDWSPSWQQQLVAQAHTVAAHTRTVGDAALAFIEAAGLPAVESTPSTIDALSILARHLPDAAGADWQFVLDPDAVRIIEQLERGLKNIAAHRDVTAQLSVPYTPAADSLDVNAVQRQWREAGQAFWPISWFKRRQVRATLAGVTQGGAMPDVAADLPRLAERQRLHAWLNDSDEARRLREVINHQWKGLETLPDVLVHARALHAAFSTALGRLAQRANGWEAWHAALLKLLGPSRAMLAPGLPLARAAASIDDAWQRLAESQRDFRDTARLAPGPEETDTSPTQGVALDAYPPTWREMTLAQLSDGYTTIIQHEHALRTWAAWRHARGQAVESGLAALVTSVEQGAVAVTDVRRVFDTNYARWWLNAAVDHEPVIRGFVSAEHEQRIRDFRALDDRFTALTRDWLRARLCAGRPSQDDVTRQSEWGVLRHEMNKKRAHLPLRELMTRIPDALARLTPCLLMSPLSIAQYLDANANAFDLVVFDEASQIPVWDAIGAIARAKQVVMVGDPKQLPPTSFFDRAESELDDEDVESDLESILDECLGANLPTRHLNWHYRSRHESLIAFSNHAYYDGKLVTFPSPVTHDRAVSLFPVNGTYQKGGARTNPAEAQALVGDIVARLSAPGFRESGRTIGIVTFNAEQQKLIEDLLDEARRQDPGLEPYFADSELEPLFIKNLESVQGDERDIIYFSITYGPDAAGQLAMNFGPLNRQGGERRLNVAITRARHELRVFSSIQPEQMDLGRTQAIGVRDLKLFLTFAERGAQVLGNADRDRQNASGTTGLEHTIAAALSDKGWQVRTQVGASSFRIDLAIVDPDAPDRYLAAVECDGATYARSATARDRDKLRESVLRGLGWNVLRVWSTDWWLDPAGTLDRLHAGLTRLTATQAVKRKES